MSTSEQTVPSVSVVIPCYNYGKYLRPCVDSVLSQMGVDTKILIIDDASQDESRRVAEMIARAEPSVEFRHHSVNKGHIATYNEGLLEWADGDYVVLLSADDRLTAGSLERSVRIMEENPNVGMVYGRHLSFEFDGDLPLVGEGVFKGATVWEGKRWLARRCREAANIVSTPTVVVRTSVQQDVGGYDPNLPHAGDFDMWLRIAVNSDVGYVRGPHQAYYRIHPGSMSQKTFEISLSDVRERKLVFDALFSRNEQVLAAAGISVKVTYQVLASEHLWKSCRAYEKASVSKSHIEECVQFARDAYPELESLRAFRALKRRERLGERFCQRTQLFVATSAVRRIADSLWWKRWRRYGPDFGLGAR